MFYIITYKTADKYCHYTHRMTANSESRLFSTEDKAREFANGKEVLCARTSTGEMLTL
jgi:hypothetical protein